MATDPPSWLNKEFLGKALQNERNNPDVIIISSKIEAATAVGENYGSTMYRITVTFKRDGNTEETSLIIKTLPEASEEIQKLMEQSPVFKNETHMYAVIIPEMQNLLNKAKHKNYQPLAAKYIYHSTKPQPVAIVLQDLKREGFKLAEQNLGLDMNHGLLVMRTIARFHACSLVLYRNNPERFETFEDSVYGKEDNAAMTNLLTVNMKAVAEEVGRWPDYKGKYYNILQPMVDTCKECWLNAVRRDYSSLNVLIHGDFWMNNIMFKYSEETGDVQDIRFVDFQMNYRTSPTVDIMYFINTSLSPDVIGQFDTLIAEYYNAFCETLTNTGNADLKPTRELLDVELRKRIPFGLLAGLSARAVIFADKDKLPDMSKLLRNEESVFLSDKYKCVLKEVLPVYEKLGWL